jgi:hypothetical protein
MRAGQLKTGLGVIESGGDGNGPIVLRGRGKPGGKECRKEQQDRRKTFPEQNPAFPYSCLTGFNRPHGGCIGSRPILVLGLNF